MTADVAVAGGDDLALGVARGQLRTSRAELRTAPLTPGPAAVCPGTVFHRRREPVVHEFTYPVSYVWLDPDRPATLCAPHRLWSSTRPAPARFRRRDYGATPHGSLADAARDDLVACLGRRPSGPVRMLTQVRRWGWLFNPITVYLVWSSDGRAVDPVDPVGAVLEVTNTPWKERVRYPLVLVPGDDGWLTAEADKILHVSPFLDEACRYRVRIRGSEDRFEIHIDVVRDGRDRPVLVTVLAVDRLPATRRVLGSALWSEPASTRRVSWGIHRQAASLWARRVPFVAHPRKRGAQR